jgi:hypothetical protein
MNRNVNMMGMNSIIFCWTGSAPVIGIIFCCSTCERPSGLA